MHTKLNQIINSVISISEDSKDKLFNLVKYIKVRKGELITAVGQKNSLEYFVIDGVFKSYLHTPDGDSITISFFMPNSIISPSNTRNNKGKSLINLQALSDGNLALIDAIEFEKLMVEDLEIRDFGNTVLRNELMAKVQKEIGLASLKGKDRLLLLRKNYPNIENMISHADVASYLGITTISLSRLRTES